MRRISILSLLITLTQCVYSQISVYNTDIPKHEVRAVWLTTIGGIDWPHSYSQSARSAERQKQELTGILDRLQKANINTVLLQTRIRGTVIYPSQYEPWDGCLSGFPGKSPGYDALQFAIDECHKRGMELHAWIVTLPLGKWNALGCSQFRKKHKGMVRKIDADGYMNPENPLTATYLADICHEITRRYDIDGIHLDYIRYPETWKRTVSQETARQNITRIVRQIHDAVKRAKPWVKMSCSPIGKYDDLSRYWSHGWNAYNKGAQEAQQWLKDELMDELFPMMYFRGDQFFPFAIDWQENSCGRIIAGGLGIYFLDPKEGNWKIGEVEQEMYHLRNTGQGHAFFRNKFLLDNHQGIFDFTAHTFDRYPALIPPMTWQSNRKPSRPTLLRTTDNDSVLTIEWTNAPTYEDGTAITAPSIYNNVYASRTYPVDTEDARNLMLARTDRRYIQWKKTTDSPLYFAVTSIDRYGNESNAMQLGAQETTKRIQRTGAAYQLKTEEGYVVLPPSIAQTDYKYLLIENLQKQTVYITGGKKDRMSIDNLKAGIYTVKYMTDKGIEHTLGYFTKRTK